MLEVIASYFGFMFTQLSALATPLRIWCFYEQFGMRTIMMLVSSGIVAFALPNLLDKSECRGERDSYIKSLFERKHYLMRLNSGLMLFFAMLAVLTYLAIWNAISEQNICTSHAQITGNAERFSIVLAIANILSLVIALFALNQKIFCIKHKQ